MNFAKTAVAFCLVPTIKYSEATIHDLARALSSIGVKVAPLTGIIGLLKVWYVVKGPSDGVLGWKEALAMMVMGGHSFSFSHGFRANYEQTKDPHLESGLCFKDCDLGPKWSNLVGVES